MLLLSMNTRYSGFMRVRGVGYKFEMKNDNTLELDVGCSKKIEIKKPEHLGISFSKKNTKIQVKGFKVKEVTLFLAKLRRLRVPEVYKGKGIRYLKDPVKLKIGKIKK